ncbi:DUF2637 domain-containing protein [Nocardia sp. CA-128927]|uniref:DUF2637 domain-containing protein n=1 Tax=Nocardia sp. CA-128927 TaxID=3239975 RepID=UPI003D995307
MADTTTEFTSNAPPSQEVRVPSRSRAHIFFWSVLAAAAAISIIGNAAQAVLHTTALPAIAATVAVVPPLALLAAVHGVSILLGTHAHARGIHFMAAAMTALIAAGAFWLSFTALRSLALLAGIPAGEAWLWPLIVEGSMAQATIALLALAHTTNRLGHRAHADGLSTCPSVNLTDTTTLEVEPPTHPGVNNGAVHTLPVATPQPNQFADIATRVCAQDPGRRRDPDIVMRILTRHHLDGWSSTQIAKEIQRSRSTVSRIISDAADLVDLTQHLTPTHQLADQRERPPMANELIAIPHSTQQAAVLHDLPTAGGASL